MYFFFQIDPISFLSYIPGSDYVTQYYFQFTDWLVGFANSHLFHVRPVLVPVNGSGDTSYGWALFWLILLLALSGTIIWSIADRKRRSYTRLNYWLCLAVRYYVAFTAFGYGIIKIFALQMNFPLVHQLATPLGDFLPMRLSWMFIGYSTPYQVFSGIMEVIAGLLLLYRRTATMGALFAAAVFINVMMLNLTYDIPVKIFSMQLVLCCLFLIASEGNRIIYFFVLNRPAAVCSLYQYRLPKKWLRIARVIAKLAFVAVAIVMPFINSYQRYTEGNQPPKKQPVNNGVYEVAVFSVNGHPQPLAIADTMRWHDVILQDGLGSIKTADTAFRQRYKRGYFVYALDSATHTLGFKKTQADSTFIIKFKYDLPDSNSIRLWGLQRSDSLYVELKRIPRRFQLAERQFHWLTEYNR